MSTELLKVCSKMTLSQSVSVSAYLIAEKLHFQESSAAARPRHAIKRALSDDGAMIGFHFGAVVFFNVPDSDIETILTTLRENAVGVYDDIMHEDTQILVSQAHSPDIVKGEILHLHEIDPNTLQIIAEVMAKSLIIEKHEALITKRFTAVKPIAAGAVKGKINPREPELLKYIGQNLFTEYELAGGAEVTDKPSMLWEQPQLEALYNTLLEEFEVTERQAIVDKKLELISRTAQTYLDISMHKHGLRLEWYIIILITVEITLQLYSMFWIGVPH